jgi:hypothetical protein
MEMTEKSGNPRWEVKQVMNFLNGKAWKKMTREKLKKRRS